MVFKYCLFDFPFSLEISHIFCKIKTVQLIRKIPNSRQHQINHGGPMNLLFLGDSITDCHHCFTADNLGNGYVKMIQNSCAGTHHVVNGGIDGATFPGIFRKWTLQYQTCLFDIVSVLGGINEVGSIMDSHMTDSQIDRLLTQSFQSLHDLLAALITTHVPLILLPEPFLFPYPAYLNAWMPYLQKVRYMIRDTAFSVCREFHDCVCQEFALLSTPETTETAMLQCRSRIVLIPLQPSLNAYAEAHGFSSVTSDGIHPTQQGHELICECLRSCLRPNLRPE